MIVNRGCSRVILIIFLLLFSQPSLAEPDIQGGQHAWAIYFAEQAKNDPVLQDLINKSPDLTKRAFLSVLVYVEINVKASPADAQRGVGYAGRLAEIIDSRFKDPKPKEILAMYLAADSKAEAAFLSYAKTLFPTYDAAPNLAAWNSLDRTAGPTAVPGLQVLAATRIYAAKWTRILSAVVFSDLGLTLQELNTHDLALQEYVKVLKENNIYTQEVQATLAEYSSAVELAKLAVATESGLLADFDSNAEGLFKNKAVLDHRVPMYLSAFRIAHRQGENPRAKAYLGQAAKAMESAENKGNPIYHYALKTAYFQQARAEGKVSTGPEVIAAFKAAWSQLESFDASHMLVIANAWQEGRNSTRFWLEELGALGKEGKPAIDIIMASFVKWQEQATSPAFLKIYLDEQHPHVLIRRQGVWTLTFAILDGLVQVFDLNPDEITKARVDQFTGYLAELLDKLKQPAYEAAGPAFPPFSLSSTEYLLELKLQNEYFQTLVPDLTTEFRKKEFQQVLTQAATLKRPEFFIDFHLKLGKQSKRFNLPDVAIQAWERAYQKADESKFIRKATEASSLLAKEFALTENWEKVSFYAAKANQGLREELGSAKGESDSRANTDLSNLAAEAHIKSNSPIKALEAIGQGHQASTAAVQLSSNPEAAKATQDLQNKRDQVAVLSHKVKSLQELPASESRNEILSKTEKLLAESRADFLSQSRNIRQKYSKLYSTGLRFDPLNLPGIQSALGAKSAVVQYFSTDEELYIFVVTPSQFRLRSVALPRAELDEMLSAFSRRLTRPVDNDPTLKSLSQSLHRTLIAPVEADLSDSSTLILIPSGQMNLLAFGALLNEQGEPLLARKTLLELAKTTDFMKIAESQAQPISTVIAFANATLDLPATETEGQSILKLFPQSKLFLGKDASKANLLQFGQQAQVLHLATHGIWDASNSLNSHLKLSGGQHLAQEEIFNLNLEGTSIVTLSACNTAVGDVKDVDYVASLAEAFWIAGSRSVVASLWPVDDASTGLLMEHFYAELKRGHGKAEALRNAQLEVRKNPNYSHPYFWSGFLLFGDYR